MAGLRVLKMLLVLMVGSVCCQENSTTVPPLTGTGSVQPAASSTPSTTAESAAVASQSSTFNKPTLNSPSTILNSTFLSETSTNSAANTSPTSTSNETSPSKHSTSQTTTSPPSTQQNTTMAATTAKNTTVPKCIYSVEAIQFGLKLKITDFTPGNYTIKVSEREGGYEKEHVVHFIAENSTHEIKRLKPCTKYELQVSFAETQLICNTTENGTAITTITAQTTGMNKDDIKDSPCSSGYFCYKSGWNISSLGSKNNNIPDAKSKDGSYHFKPAYMDICSQFILKFPSESCTNFSFTEPKYVPVGFIDPNDIIQQKPTKFPAEIKPVFPSSCTNLSIEYKCFETNTSVEPSDMKPFTNYTCTGDIKDNNVSIKKTTPPVQFNINCDFTVIKLKNISTSTSIKLNWTTTSDNCQAVLHKLDELKLLAYECSCQPGLNAKRTAEEVYGGTCDIKDLKPWIDYNCGVRPIYGDERHFNEGTIRVKTDPGNNKDLFGIFIFLSIIIVFTIICVVFNRKRLNFLSEVKKEQLTNSTVVYTNMPPPKRSQEHEAADQDTI